MVCHSGPATEPEPTGARDLPTHGSWAANLLMAYPRQGRVSNCSIPATIPGDRPFPSPNETGPVNRSHSLTCLPRTQGSAFPALLRWSNRHSQRNTRGVSGSWIPTRALAPDIHHRSPGFGYLSLQPVSAEMERFLVEMVQAGSARRSMESYSLPLEGLDVGVAEASRLVTRMSPGSFPGGRRLTHDGLKQLGRVGRKTASRQNAIPRGHDPPPGRNRLPKCGTNRPPPLKDRYLLGGSMPAVRAVLTGRNPDVAWCPRTSSGCRRLLDPEAMQGRASVSRGLTNELPCRERKEAISEEEAPMEVTFLRERNGVLMAILTERITTFRPDGPANQVRDWCRVHRMWSVASVEEGWRRLGRWSPLGHFLLADANGTSVPDVGVDAERRDG